MIQLGSILRVADKSGVVYVQCIKVFSTSKDRIAYMGEIILVVVRWVNPNRLKFIKERKRKRLLKGTLHRALIIRSKTNFLRHTGILVKFDENSVILVSRNLVPISNRAYVQF